MGSEEQHMAVRTAILNHMIDIAHFLLGHHIPPQYSSVQDYIQDKGMDQPHIWGTDVEIVTLAHLLTRYIEKKSIPMTALWCPAFSNHG